MRGAVKMLLRRLIHLLSRIRQNTALSTEVEGAE